MEADLLAWSGDAAIDKMAIKATTGMGIGELVSKVVVERNGEPVFIPCHMRRQYGLKVSAKG